MSDMYILKGKVPVKCKDVHEWGEWFEKAERHIGDYKYRGIRISTVFLGLDHRYLGRGKPILFETIVFGGKLDGEQERYCTWKEAEKGHKEMIERVKANRVGLLKRLYLLLGHWCES